MNIDNLGNTFFCLVLIVQLVFFFTRGVEFISVCPLPVPCPVPVLVNGKVFFFLKKKATKRKETGKVCGKFVCLFVFGVVLCIGRQLELIVWDVWDGDSVR